MKFIPSWLRAFIADSKGTAVIESVILLPTLIFAYIGFAIVWDLHRDTNLAQKATFALADIISRERAVVAETMMLNYVRAMGYAAEVPTSFTSTNMKSANAPVAVRITSVLFDEADTVGGTDNVTLQFSMTSNATQLPAHTAASVQAIKNRIPALQDGDNIIIVETRLKWAPLINAEDATSLIKNNNNRTSASDNAKWFAARNIDTFTTVRPRFVPRLCWQIGMTVSTCSL